VICTHSLNDYLKLKEAVASIVAQTYQAGEIILVVDGNPELYQKIRQDLGQKEPFKVILLKQNMGISGARNAGIGAASGEIIAFMDDDATAKKDWIETLIATYKKYDAISVGGKILPDWEAGAAPDYFPEELYWLVGVINQGFADDKIGEVRNTFGPNMSFKKSVFEEIGVFNQGFGFSGNSCVQAEEPELSLRMKKKFSRGVTYNPQAIVYHKIPRSKLKIGLLIKRSFYQGYSKALINKLDKSTDPLNTERTYLKYLILKSIPGRLKKFYRLSELKKVFVLIASIAGVGLGFLFGSVKGKNVKRANQP
jgi:glucosyl-dolichyl phosphate glucuronosyltransferase